MGASGAASLFGAGLVPADLTGAVAVLVATASRVEMEPAFSGDASLADDGSALSSSAGVAMTGPKATMSLAGLAPASGAALGDICATAGVPIVAAVFVV